MAGPCFGSGRRGNCFGLAVEVRLDGFLGRARQILPVVSCGKAAGEVGKGGPIGATFFFVYVDRVEHEVLLGRPLIAGRLA